MFSLDVVHICFFLFKSLFLFTTFIHFILIFVPYWRKQLKKDLIIIFNLNSHPYERCPLWWEILISQKIIFFINKRLSQKIIVATLKNQILEYWLENSIAFKIFSNLRTPLPQEIIVLIFFFIWVFSCILFFIFLLSAIFYIV